MWWKPKPPHDVQEQVEVSESKATRSHRNESKLRPMRSPSKRESVTSRRRQSESRPAPTGCPSRSIGSTILRPNVLQPAKPTDHDVQYPAKFLEDALAAPKSSMMRVSRDWSNSNPYHTQAKINQAKKSPGAEEELPDKPAETKCYTAEGPETLDADIQTCPQPRQAARRFPSKFKIS
ncbi:hypothetical protein PC120_g3596 [Phytophthora cactorum]|nr:hypothetical protein PC120_g3596 [Phytophthora cactorum]